MGKKSKKLFRNTEKARDLENLEHCIDFCEMAKFQIQEMSGNK